MASRTLLFLLLLLSHVLNAQTFELIGPCFGSSFGIFNNRLYFESTDSIVQLASTDGTIGGTQPIKQINVNPNNPSYVSNCVVFRNRLFFVADDGIHLSQIWSTDGSTGGTNMAFDLRAFYNDGYPNNLFVFDSVLLFTAEDSSLGTDLFATDGTPSGTVKLKNISNSNMFYPSFASLNGKVVFESYDGIHGSRFWITDGTVNGTTPFLSGFSQTSDFVPYQGKLFFTSSDSSSIIGLWATDGTTNGTQNVFSSNPDSIKGFGNPVVFNNKLYFSASSPSGRLQLWATDATPAGTQLVKSISNISNTIANYCQANGKLFFQADDGINGAQLWVSDGTSTGTHMVKNLNPTMPQNQQSSSPRNMIAYNYKLYFTAAIPMETGWNLVVSDGTDTGTTIIFPGQYLTGDNPLTEANLNNMKVVNGSLIFPAQWINSTVNLWKITTSPSGVPELQESLPVNLFPNPASDYINLSSPINMEGIATIKDIAGKIVSITTGINTKAQAISTKLFSPGIYFLELQNDKSFTVKKFIKQ